MAFLSVNRMDVVQGRNKVVHDNTMIYDTPRTEMREARARSHFRHMYVFGSFSGIYITRSVYMVSVCCIVSNSSSLFLSYCS